MNMRGWLVGWLVLGLVPAAQAAPHVVVSIKPVHALVAGVMRGVATPELLLQGTSSPHGYSLRPSQARSLARADLIVWVGPSLESFLVRPLATNGGRARVVELLDAPGVQRLPARAGGAWEADADEPAPAAGAVDPHLWLSPANAAATVREVATALVALDPAHGAAYRANEGRMLARIAALQGELMAQLAPVRDVPFVVFHDAYQYFDRAFGLRAVGSITVDPERAPGARRLKAMRAKVRALKVRAVFTEPQFSPQLAQTVVEDSGARLGVLDPLGAALRPGEDAWFELMRKLAGTLVATLGH